MAMIKVYGIPNCNTVKKALDWLKAQKLDYEFHDYKKEGITIKKLNTWCMEFKWETLLNKAGTTWKSLPEDEKQSVVDQASAVKIMAEYTSIIKRPVVEADDKYLVRFDAQQYADVLLKK